MKEDPPGAAPASRRFRRPPPRAGSSTTSSRRSATTTLAGVEGLREQDAEDRDAGAGRAAAGPANAQGEEAARRPAPRTRAPSFSSGWASAAASAGRRARARSTPQDVVSPAGLRDVEAAPLRARGRLLHLARAAAVGAVPLPARSPAPTTFHSVRTPTECGGRHLLARARYAFAGFGRATLLLRRGRLRTYVAGTAGLGTIRHVATFESQTRSAAAIAATRSASTPCRRGPSSSVPARASCTT